MVLASSQASSSPFLLYYISVIYAPLILACPYVFIPLIERKKSYISVTLFFCGANGNRTSDTRIFSPLLSRPPKADAFGGNQLSYGTLSSQRAKLSLYLFCGLTHGLTRGYSEIGVINTLIISM